MKYGTALLLRTCDSDGRAYGGFQWPLVVGASVVSRHWNPESVCGDGLHGLLWGEGDTHYLSCEATAIWMVVEADASTIVDIKGKVKVPACRIVHIGDKESAVAFLQADPRSAGKAIVFGTARAGDSGTAITGEYGTATAGERGTATAGRRGTATAGLNGTAIAGYAGTATASYAGTATVGKAGTATAGDYGTATAGDGGTATAGDGGTATAGNHGTATAGDHGTATAGEGGTISVRYWDPLLGRYRVADGDVGIDGIEADTAYVVADGKLTRKETP